MTGCIGYGREAQREQVGPRQREIGWGLLPHAIDVMRQVR